LAPHIVITPPEYYWADFFISSQNRPNFPWPPHGLTLSALQVPYSNNMPRSNNRARAKNYWPHRSDGLLTGDSPRKVFSHEEFSDTVMQCGFDFCLNTVLNCILGPKGIGRGSPLERNINYVTT
jgi:hypothetical protein